MFGFLRPLHQDDAYRAVYARCCELHHQAYGRLAALFHSYEAVCLYLYALDAGAVPAEGVAARRCCRLRSRRGHAGSDAAVGRFAASLSLLLAALKLSDDVRDQGSRRARLLSWLLRRRIADAGRYFALLDPGFAQAVDGYVAQHLALERAGAAVALADYCRPTAAAFAHVFGLLARLPRLSGHGDNLAVLGEHVGAAVIAYDCAADWDEDRARGQFNPLVSAADRADALVRARDLLERASRLCRGWFGEATRTGKLFDGVASRVASAATRRGQRSAASPAGTPREPGLRASVGRLLRPAAALVAGVLGPLCGVLSVAPQRETGCCGQEQEAYYEEGYPCCGRRTAVDVGPDTAVEHGTDCCGNPTTTYSGGCCRTTVTEKQDCCGNPGYEKRSGC